VQATALSSDVLAPLGEAGVVAAHFVPFQCWPSANRLLPMPTARQDDEPGQASPMSSPLLVLGVLTTDHFEPFHFSVSDPLSELGNQYPTAQHSLAEPQATPLSTSGLAVLGLGLDTIDHLEPFHRSIRVAKLDVPLEEPAAQQFVELVQVMAPRKVVLKPDGDGALTSDHLVPFHFSAATSVVRLELTK
jgi:hypothetical protein